jgi:hypothetical protein
MNDGDFLDLTAPQQRVQFAGLRYNRQVTDNLPDFLVVRPSRGTGILGTPHFGGGNHLHSPGDFGDALYTADSSAN